MQTTTQSSSSPKMTKFQQIKMRVAKMPTYRGQREKDIERRLKNDAYFQQMGVKKTSNKIQRPSFIRVLQSLQDDGLLDQEKPKKEARVLDAETLCSVKKINKTHEYVQQIHEISKYENEKANLTRKLYELGHDLEKRLKQGRNPIEASSDPSPAVRSFWKHINCSDSRVARHYLKTSGWDTSRATKRYFESEDHKILGSRSDDDDDDDEIFVEQEERGKKEMKERKFRSTLQNTFEFMKRKLVHPTDQRLNLQTTLPDAYLRNGKPYKSLLAMRQAHSAQILNLINQEEDREKERQRQLKYALPKNRRRMQRRFEIERKEAQRLMENVRSDNETILTKRMIDMGLLR